MHAHTDGWNWYARTNVRRADGSKTAIKMHRLILGLTDPRVHVDHIDGNGLNNRRENLRTCNRSENMSNRRKHKNNTSGYKGVCWDNQHGRWRADIKLNGKRKHLGLFTNPEEAYQAYCAAAIKMHGEYANFGQQAMEQS